MLGAIARFLGPLFGLLPGLPSWAFHLLSIATIAALLVGAGYLQGRAGRAELIAAADARCEAWIAQEKRNQVGQVLSAMRQSRIAEELVRTMPTPEDLAARCAICARSASCRDRQKCREGKI